MSDAKLVRVRIRSTGQVLDLIPNVARAMLNGKMAELIEDPNKNKPEAATMAQPASAVSRKQTPAKKLGRR